MIFGNHINLKINIDNGYFESEDISTVGLNKNTIKKYIREQEKEDISQDKRSVKEYKLRVVRVKKVKSSPCGSCRSYALIGFREINS